MQETAETAVTAEAPPRAVVEKGEMEATAIQVKVVTAVRVPIVPQAEGVMGAVEAMDRKAEARAGRAVLALPGVEVVGVMVQKSDLAQGV
jgi:hypothetical protein